VTLRAVGDSIRIAVIRKKSETVVWPYLHSTSICSPRRLIVPWRASVPTNLSISSEVQLGFRYLSWIEIYSLDGFGSRLDWMPAALTVCLEKDGFKMTNLPRWLIKIEWKSDVGIIPSTS
jgi:hypothetical protein